MMHHILFAAFTLSANARPPSTSAPSPSLTANSSSTFWQPAVGATWQIILDGVVDTKAALVPNVDIFDIDGESHSKQDITALHAKGKKIICYFSAGTVEKGRPDVGPIEQYTGNVLPDWPDEKWVDVRVRAVRDVMANRIEEYAAKGCDALDPDNVDIYDNDNGLNNFKIGDSIDYVKWLSTEAAKHGMNIGLKNAGDLSAWILRDSDNALIRSHHT